MRELESLDLVARTPDSEDRRRTWIELTDAGYERLAQERSTGLRWLERAVAERLTLKEKKTLAAAIPVLHKLMEEAPIA